MSKFDSLQTLQTDDIEPISTDKDIINMFFSYPTSSVSFSTSSRSIILIVSLSLLFMLLSSRFCSRFNYIIKSFIFILLTILFCKFF
jgi:hypothetical protein